MKWFYRTFILLLLCLVISCTNQKDKVGLYYETDVQQWKEYFATIGADIELESSLVLLANPAYCGECHSELSQWNSLLADLPDSTIYLILIDRYTSNIDSYMKREGFEFPYYYDTSSIVLRDSLVGALPRKVFFKNNSINSVTKIGDAKSFHELKKELMIE